jgi:hypothetical protein
MIRDAEPLKSDLGRGVGGSVRMTDWLVVKFVTRWRGIVANTNTFELERRRP